MSDFRVSKARLTACVVRLELCWLDATYMHTHHAFAQLSPQDAVEPARPQRGLGNGGIGYLRGIAMQNLGPRLIRLCLIGVLAAALHPAPAAAQLFWDWGGGSEVASSGREMVRFNAPFEPGHIVVSFGDRRLYFVNAPGEAISYPIAIPREEDRWEGATTVTNKRVNPSWTPTPTMVAEKILACRAGCRVDTR